MSVFRCHEYRTDFSVIRVISKPELRMQVNTRHAHNMNDIPSIIMHTVQSFYTLNKVSISDLKIEFQLI
jgi:hypothetical protein